MKTSQISRLGKIGKSLIKASAHLGSDLVQSRLGSNIADQGRKIKAAKEIVESMGELKGALMKIGQMLSITDDMFLPKEVSQVFKKLQNQVSFYPYNQVKEIYYNNFHRYPEDDFIYFSKEPIASASIGQVHLAKLSTGQRLAVKIQYPEVAQAITNDLKNIQALKKLITLIAPNIPNADHIIEELRENLLAECDYQKELQNLELFKKLYENSFPQIIIPEVYRQYSNDKIISTEYISADTFQESLNYSQEDKNFLGQLLYDSYLYSFFTKNTLHADPHDGNYLFQPGKIVLLDFGSIKKFNVEFIDDYAIMCHSVLAKNQDLFQKAALRLGILTHKSSAQDCLYLYQLACNIYEPFIANGSYPITDLNPFKMISKFVSKIDFKSYQQAPHKDFLMIDRANIGLFAKLKSWQSQVDWELGREKFQYPREQKALKNL